MTKTKQIAGYFMNFSREGRYASATLHFTDGSTRSVDATHQNFSKIVSALQKKDFKTVAVLLDPVIIMKSYVKSGNHEIRNNVTFDGQRIFFKGKEINPVMREYIVLMHKNGHDITNLLNFLNRLLENPSQQSQEQLFGFLRYGRNFINEDGTFKAYRVVTENYKDKHTMKMDNSIGAVVGMPRLEVDPDPNRTCSSGLHVCSRSYVAHFYNKNRRDRIVEVSVCPSDVVAVPRDYENSKMRVSSFKVVRDITEEYLQENDSLSYTPEYEGARSQEKIIADNFALIQSIFEKLASN